MGEATSDFFVYSINRYLAVIAGFIVFCFALWLQLRARRYHAPVYWFAVTMVAVFGTMVADSIHIVLGVPYQFSSAGFAVILAVVLIAWYRSEHTLSIHSIYTRRRELFYWATVLSTFALGTAAGDMTAYSLHLGYLVSGLLFTALFLVPGILWFGAGLNEIAAFWAAYILTRPLGASFADLFGMSKSVGGLGYGHGPVAIILTIAIAIVVGYLTATRLDVPRESTQRR